MVTRFEKRAAWQRGRNRFQWIWSRIVFCLIRALKRHYVVFVRVLPSPVHSHFLISWPQRAFTWHRLMQTHLTLDSWDELSTLWGNLNVRHYLWSMVNHKWRGFYCPHHDSCIMQWQEIVLFSNYKSSLCCGKATRNPCYADEGLKGNIMGWSWVTYPNPPLIFLYCCSLCPLWPLHKRWVSNAGEILGALPVNLICSVQNW